MSRISELQHRFVHYIPDLIEDGVLFVSIEFGTTVHRCCCGCGQEVVAVLSPTDWSLHFNGDTVSIDPSIGNWSLPCQSHYWIRRNKILWARTWSRDEIELGRTVDQVRKQRHYGGLSSDELDFGSDVPSGFEPNMTPPRRD